MREYFVPVFNLKTRKLTIFRQSATDPNAAACAARRRFASARVYAPRETRPDQDELTRMETLAHLPHRERARFEGKVL